MAEFQQNIPRGLERASSKLAEVLDFTLKQQLSQDQNRRALEAAEQQRQQEQQFRKTLQSNEVSAAIAREKSAQRFKASQQEADRELRRAELLERQRHNQSLEGIQGQDINLDRDKLKQRKAEMLVKEAENKQNTEIKPLQKQIDQMMDELELTVPTFDADGQLLDSADQIEAKNLRRSLLLQQIQNKQSLLDQKLGLQTPIEGFGGDGRSIGRQVINAPGGAQQDSTSTNDPFNIRGRLNGGGR